MKLKIYTPVITVFKEDDTFDLEGNIRMMNYLADRGVDGIVPLGSTGEYPSIPMRQKRDYLDEYIDAAEGKTELLVGSGGVNPKETVSLSNHILKKGRRCVKGVLVISEFYYHMDGEDFYRYYSWMAEQIEGPVYLYNYPQRTGSSIPPKTVERLAARYPNISGLKDSVTDFSHTEEVLQRVLPVRPDFQVFSGYDSQVLMNRDKGGAGGIGALSNLVPELAAGLIKAANENDSQGEARAMERIQGLMELYTLCSNPQKLFKELLRYRGVDISARCLFPFDAISAEALGRGKEILETYGLKGAR